MRPHGFIRQNKEISDDHVDKVRKKSGFKSLKSCPICSSKGSNFFLNKSSIDYVRCINCFCTYPTYIPLDVRDIYFGEEYLSEFIEVDGEREEYKKKRFGLERLKIISDYFGSSLKNMKLLDVGCGTGWFMQLCNEQGIDSYGQELGASLAKYVRKRTGSIIFDKSIEQITGYDDFFDIVVLFDLIEHLENPIFFINKLKSMLKKGGIIFIMTPNVDSFGVQNLNENSSLLMPTDHISLFTPKTISCLSNIVDMKLDFISFNGIDIGDYLANLENENYVIGNEVKQRIYDDIQPIIDRFSFSNHLRFILLKTS